MERLSDHYREILKNEILLALDKMRVGQPLGEKLFFFSAIPGMIQRVFNLEYNSDLIFAYLVTQKTYEAFYQTAENIKRGDVSVPLFEKHLTALDAAIVQLHQALEKKGSITPALKTFSIIAYSLTGNGRYLMEKNMLKIE